MKKAFWILWVLFLPQLFFGLASGLDNWLILEIISAALSFWLIRKNGLPSRHYLKISILFAALASAAYFGYRQTASILIYGLFRAGIPTLLASFAVFSVMEKMGGFDLFSRKGPFASFTSILIGLAVGVVLSVVNLFLSGEKVEVHFTMWNLFLSLNPAIFEEMACRAIFMAYCVFYSGKKKMNLWEVFTTYFMMSVPHSLSHGYGPAETLVLSLIFGLPFAFLQRKRDINSAMISHGFVDAVRFSLLGY